MLYLYSLLVVIKVSLLDIHRKRPAINKFIKNSSEKMTKKGTVYMTHPVGQNYYFVEGVNSKFTILVW